MQLRHYIILPFLLFVMSVGTANANDSSADVGSLSNVERSAGVIVRVEINEDGDENVASASMRLHVDDAVPDNEAAIVDAWHESVEVRDEEKIDGTDIDSSTCHRGWFWGRGYRYMHGGRFFGGPGRCNPWYGAGYYGGFRPRYYCGRGGIGGGGGFGGGSYYNYGAPYSYSNWGAGQRYYYYPSYGGMGRGW